VSETRPHLKAVGSEPKEGLAGDAGAAARQPQPDAGGGDFMRCLNPHSLTVARGWIEPSLAGVGSEQRFQFERHGYFVTDRVTHRPEVPVFNRITGLKDSWSK
jgi:glutaminyl-tRNA synthetase